MRHVGETIRTTREYLALEEIQLAVGELAMSGTGFSLVAGEIVLNRFSIITWMAGGIVGMNAGREGLNHWRQARQKLVSKSPDSIN